MAGNRAIAIKPGEMEVFSGRPLKQANREKQNRTLDTERLRARHADKACDRHNHVLGTARKPRGLFHRGTQLPQWYYEESAHGRE